MRIKSLMLVLFCAACFHKTDAQQIFAISQYMQHNFIYNPAAAGAADNPSVGVFYRQMWNDIDGGPQTTIIYGDTYFGKKRTGLSVFVYDDKTGPTSRTGGQFSLSYGLNLDNTGTKRLQFGLGGSFMQYKVDKAWIINNDPYFDANDQNFYNAPSSKFTGDAAAGIYYKSPTLNVGVSAQQIIQTQLNLVKGPGITTPGQLYSHYYVMADYNLRTDDEDVLVPSAMLMLQPNAPIDFQAGAKLVHQDILWIGFGYHYKQSYSAYAGLKFAHKLEIGYAYDQYMTPLSILSSSGGASNELSLRYYFLKKK